MAAAPSVSMVFSDIEASCVGWNLQFTMKNRHMQMNWLEECYDQEIFATGLGCYPRIFPVSAGGTLYRSAQNDRKKTRGSRGKSA